MALKAADRVKENTNTSGTGALTLTGAVQNFVTFDSVLTNGDTTYYCIVDNNTTNWEVGRGTFTSPATLSRDEVFSSSNSGALVNFTSATKDVFINYPANKALYLDINSDVTLPDDLVVTNTTSSGTFVGGNVTSGSNPGHTHTLNSGATDVTATASELNLLDLSGLTVNDVLVADSATTASWQQLTLSDISDAGTGITLDYVTTNGNTTTNSVTVGNFNSASITGDDIVLTNGLSYTDAGAVNFQIGSSIATDITMNFNHPTAGYDWAIGVDNTDGAFTISNSTGLGTSDYVKFDASAANFQDNNIITTGSLTIGADTTTVHNVNGSFVITNEIQIADGSLSDPAYAFTNQQNTGMFLNTSGNLAFAVGGTLGLNIDATTADFDNNNITTTGNITANGNVATVQAGYHYGLKTGTGGAASNNWLHLRDNDATSDFAFVYQGGGQWQMRTENSTSAGNIIATIDGNGNWDFDNNNITTTGDINAGLDDNSTHVFEGFLTVNNEIQVSDGTAADPSYTFTTYSTTGLYASLNNLNFSVNGTNEASLSTTEFNLPSNRVTIGSTEDVGLNQNGALVIGNRAGVNIGIDNNEIMARNNSAAAVLSININGGRVDIGSGGLDVAGDIIGPTSGGFYAANDGNNTDTSNTTPAQATTNVGTGCKIYGGSDNGTDLTEPANINICSHWGLAFMGSLGPGVWYTNGCGQHIPSHLFNCRTGDFTARGDVTAFGGASDIRLKKDIEPIDNAVERLEKINGVNFTYKDNPDKPMIGVIAQELLEDDVLKKLVYETGEDKHYAVRYEHLTAILVQAVKELSARVKELESAN
jgi:hypothetical protein